MTTATVKKISKKAEKALEVEYAREKLLTHYLTEGDTVYTVLRSVSSSGMSRTMSLKTVEDGKIIDITYYAAAALDYPLVEVNGSRALRVGGCGMDMGFHIVYSLSGVLFRKAGESSDSGYLLNHSWL